MLLSTSQASPSLPPTAATIKELLTVIDLHFELLKTADGDDGVNEDYEDDAYDAYDDDDLIEDL